MDPGLWISPVDLVHGPPRGPPQSPLTFEDEFLYVLQSWRDCCAQGYFLGGGVVNEKIDTYYFTAVTVTIRIRSAPVHTGPQEKEEK